MKGEGRKDARAVPDSSFILPPSSFQMIDPSDSSFEQLPLDAKRRVDAACERFEEAWRQGRPALEEFCREVPQEEQGVLLAELLHIDIECRRRAGEAPRASDYLPRLPGTRPSSAPSCLIRAARQGSASPP